MIQARLGSSRLPKKILAAINGKPMLSHVIERAKAIPGIDAVAVTIPDTSPDYRIFDFCEDCYVTTGPEDDVRRRYQIAADASGARRIVRITSDCPLVDPVLAHAVVNLQTQTGAPYTSNVWPKRTYPDGLDVEVMTREALDGLTVPDEHVTTALHTAEAPCLQGAVDLGYLKWSVDTPAELEFVRRVMPHVPAGHFTMVDTLKAIQAADMWGAQPRSDDYLRSHRW